MSGHKQTPEEMREKLRQEELKRPPSSVHGGNLADLVGGLGWKATGIILLVLIIGLAAIFIMTSI